MTSLDAFPTELLLEIATNLLPEDQINLSIASKRLRCILEPRVFESIKIDFGASRLDAADFVRTMGHYVKRLNVDVLLVPGRRDLKTLQKTYIQTRLCTPLQCNDLAHRHPNSSYTATTMVRGDHFPNCNTILIALEPFEEFHTGEWYPARGQQTNFPWFNIEEPEDLEHMEESYQWRQDLNRLWTVLSSSGSKFTTLALLDYIPRQASVFQSEQWRHFIEGLELLQIHLWWTVTTGWNSLLASEPLRTPAMDGYGQEIERMDAVFFDHCRNLKSLHFGAHEEGIVGSEEAVRLPFLHSELPKLRRLTLNTILLDGTLFEFIESHETLRTLNLDNCYMGPTATWEELFHFVTFDAASLRYVLIVPEPDEVRDGLEEEFDAFKSMMGDILDETDKVDIVSEEDVSSEQDDESVASMCECCRGDRHSDWSDSGGIPESAKSCMIWQYATLTEFGELIPTHLEDILVHSRDWEAWEVMDYELFSRVMVDLGLK